ncbi:MAG: serine/threonine-protein kinase [Pirellulales bacterium]
MSDTHAHAIDETLRRGDSVDEARRREFEVAWLNGNAPRIEDFLPAKDAPSYLATLTELVHIDLEFSWKAFAKQRHEFATILPGEHSAGATSIEDYLNRFGALRHTGILLGIVQHEYALRQRFEDQPTLDEYRQRFPQFALSIETLGAECLVDTGRSVSAVATKSLLERGPADFGEYKLLEEIGRGGMGIVFRAHHPLTDRIVALKVIRQDRFQNPTDSSQSSIVERFRNEVQAAARLDHENIVTVYEVGDVDGDQYYAMRYVDGQSLGEIVRDGPIPKVRAASYMEGVARALQVAHEAGVLHRDLKPQNILIDSKMDRALVTDFGLAKLQQAGDSLTRAGDVVGTPSYMAPEQARDAAHVTPAADVYGIGATLYQLVTGRPPFQAATAVETLRQVMYEEPVLPSQLNPEVDRDVETICLKCLQKEPTRRYESAAAVGEDLARYLRGEPIKARPINVLDRAVRWFRRNPVLAATASAAALFLVVALAASFVGYVKTSAALADSEENYELARNTIDELYTRVSEDLLLGEPGMQKLRQSLLRKALEHYQHFVAWRGDDQQLRRETGLAHFRMGRITEELDSSENAMAAFRRAYEMQKALVEDRPNDLQAVEDLGTTANAMGASYRKMEDLDKAVSSFEEAFELREKLSKEKPDDPEYKRILANTLMNIGLVEKAQGKLKKARQHMDHGQRLRHDVAAATPGDHRILRDRGMGYFNSGTLALSEHDLAAAEKNFHLAIDEFQAVRKQAPELHIDGKLLLCYRMLGHVQFVRAKQLAGQQAPHRQQVQEEARLNYNAALEIAKDLAKRNELVIDYRRDLAGIYIHLARWEYELDSYEKAAEFYDKARQELLPIMEKSPLIRWDLSKALHGLGFLYVKQGDHQKAADVLTEAREQLDVLIVDHPQNGEYRRDRDKVQELLAKVSIQEKQEN